MPPEGRLKKEENLKVPVDIQKTEEENEFQANNVVTNSNWSAIEMVESKLMTEVADLKNKMFNIEEKLGDEDLEISNLKEEL